jgi:tryptophanase
MTDAGFLTIIEPFRVKAVEPVHMTTREQRRAALRVADDSRAGAPPPPSSSDCSQTPAWGATFSWPWAGMMPGDPPSRDH